MKKCSICKQHNSSSAETCSHCGAVLQADSTQSSMRDLTSAKMCTECKLEVGSTDPICPHCQGKVVTYLSKSSLGIPRNTPLKFSAMIPLAKAVSFLLGGLVLLRLGNGRGLALPLIACGFISFFRALIDLFSIQE